MTQSLELYRNNWTMNKEQFKATFEFPWYEDVEPAYDRTGEVIDGLLVMDMNYVFMNERNLLAIIPYTYVDNDRKVIEISRVDLELERVVVNGHLERDYTVASIDHWDTMEHLYKDLDEYVLAIHTYTETLQGTTRVHWDLDDYFTIVRHFDGFNKVGKNVFL